MLLINQSIIPTKKKFKQSTFNVKKKKKKKRERGGSREVLTRINQVRHGSWMGRSSLDNFDPNLIGLNSNPTRCPITPVRIVLTLIHYYTETEQNKLSLSF